MIFSSVEFFVFLAVLLAVLSVTPRQHWRRDLLLVSSYVFYGWWDWRFCFLILGSTALDYYAGRRIHEAPTKTQAKRWLIVSLCANLGMLGFFKYMNFFLGSLTAALGTELPHLNIILPVGISFFTFQTMSYSIDIYRGRLKPAAGFREFALFVAFFPQLVAGPIVRASEFLPQLNVIPSIRRPQIREGLDIFVKGFVKKVLFADTLAILVDPVFSEPTLYSPGTCWWAAIAYAGQIYYDFSGYSEMAIGVAKMVGFELPTNFLHPYQSRSITEFWRRWHISLSTWLRDYLYISLGGNRGGLKRTYFNLMATMVLGGLWHGASWNFVIWGTLHGIALAAHKWFRAVRPLEPDAKPSLASNLTAWFGTQLLVLICWVFFRAQDFPTAFAYLGQMARLGQDTWGIRWHHTPSLIVIAVGTALHVAVVLRQERPLSFGLQTPRGWAMAGLAMVLVLLFAPLDVSPFIYFQF